MAPKIEQQGAYHCGQGRGQTECEVVYLTKIETHAEAQAKEQCLEQQQCAKSFIYNRYVKHDVILAYLTAQCGILTAMPH